MGADQSNERNRLTYGEKERLRDVGVLIPPAFGVGHETLLPPSTVQRVGAASGILDGAARAVPPSGLSYLQYVRQLRLPSDRILRDHMTPGLWLLATATHDSAVLASFAAPDDKGRTEGMLNVTSKGTALGQLELRAMSSGLPVLMSSFKPLSGVTAQGDISMGGESLGIGCHVNLTHVLQKLRNTEKARSEYYRNDPFSYETGRQATTPKIHLGSWVRSSRSSGLRVDGVNGYAALELPNGGIAAVEGCVPLKTGSAWRSPSYSYLLSMDLNAAVINGTRPNEPPTGPPLVVTLQQTPNVLSMDLSQIMTFDRDVINILESRCPKIRNRIGWTVQLEKPMHASTMTTSSGMDANANGNSSSDATLSFGIAWQLNRAVCLKMNTSTVPSSDSNPKVTGAFVLKRWMQPRVTCSIQFGRHGFQGIGLELETGSDISASDDVYGDKLHSHVSNEAVPETKTTLPEQGF